jgi:hypothetical protein
MTAQTRTKRAPDPAQTALKLAKSLGIVAGGVTVAADGSITIFDTKSPASVNVPNDRQSEAEKALEAWRKEQTARV